MKTLPFTVTFGTRTTSYIMTSSKGVEKRTFLSNETLKRAYVRSIEVIGEAVKQIPDALRQKYPGVEWASIARMRDRLIHGYFGIDYDIVWDVVINKLPSLDAEIKKIMNREFPLLP
jgi:uncharacterized protein with HEPN domain